MANTEEFHWLPEDGMKTENKPSIKTVRFGDGYEQRSPNGLNHSLRVFTCDFKVEANERDSFEKFLARHEGYKSFFWRPPGINRKIRVVCRTWSATEHITYNRSNVVMPDDGAPFRYSFSALKDRHNAVEVNWIDPDNGWETATELVEDTQAIARYGRNVTKMDAFGCTSRGQAHRAGLWLIKTELLETQTVDFSVGAEGLRHVPGDVIEICDDDYAGISTGGRVLAVNSQTRTLTLDREITLPSSGTTLISLVDGSGNPVSVEVQSVTDGLKVKVNRVPDGVAEYSVWGLKLPTLRQRLFRCVSIRENDDGTYAIT
ncbi:phage tail protein, partial [Escherichia coli]|nr:phage tail protein [Escherichia coli]MCA7845674.1 phage tail protein [Escherichia coli]